MGLLKKFAKTMLENLADDKDDNKEKDGQGSLVLGSKEHKEYLKKVQNDPAMKAMEDKIQEDLEDLHKSEIELRKKLKKLPKA